MWDLPILATIASSATWAFTTEPTTFISISINSAIRAPARHLGNLSRRVSSIRYHALSGW